MPTRPETLLLGVLGGMGPLATGEFLVRLARESPARSDQFHQPTLTYSQPAIHDRSAFLLGKGENPKPALISAAKFLAKSGVSALAIPCNTAHFWATDIASAAGVPVIHIAEATKRSCVRRSISRGQLLILATRGTLKSEIYESVFQGTCWEISPPSESVQNLVDEIVTFIKSGNKEQGTSTAENLVKRCELRQYSAVLLACTELPIAFSGLVLPIPTVDTLTCLAHACLDWYAQERAD